MPWEVVFVDDGSRDGSYERLAALSAADSRIKVVRFSRNFGHQAAIAAGLSWARGEAVAILDADLQDPPELIATCLQHWREGDQVVYCQREERKEGPSSGCCTPPSTGSFARRPRSRCRSTRVTSA